MQENIIRKAIANLGNLNKLKACMKKAENEEAVTIAFLGGSITQGSLSSTPETCYAYLVFEWWKKKFPNASFQYINGGIGGTSSQFGVARVEDHIQVHEPDFLIVEFSVNDTADEFFEETYEGLIRKIYSVEKVPAVLIVNNVYYDTGTNAQEYHNKIGKAYEIPCISIKDSLYPMIAEGTLQEEEITPDHLHPNDKGHKIISEIITGFLELVYEDRNNIETLPILPQAPLTKNQYENSICYQNDNAKPELLGFIADEREQDDIRDIFKKGWIASKIGDKITFKVFGTGIAIQYRKSVKKPTPIASVVIDDKTEKKILLDGNFQEDWGDCLYLETVYFHGEETEHTVTIEIVEATENDVVPFYLVSVITSL